MNVDDLMGFLVIDTRRARCVEGDLHAEPG